MWTASLIIENYREEISKSKKKKELEIYIPNPHNSLLSRLLIKKYILKFQNLISFRFRAFLFINFHISNWSIISFSRLFSQRRGKYGWSNELEYSVNECRRTWISRSNSAQEEFQATQMYFSLPTKSCFRILIILIFIECNLNCKLIGSTQTIVLKI